jgi:ATP-binding cassette subfamily F protein 1
MFACLASDSDQSADECNNSSDTNENANSDCEEIKQESEHKLTQTKKEPTKSVQNESKKTPKKLDEIKHYVTLFADKIEIYAGGKKIINESTIVINSETKYFLMGINGSGKTTTLKYLYENIKGSCDILMIDQEIKIESTDQTIGDFILYAKPELYEKYKQMHELEKLDELSDEQNDCYKVLSEYVYSHEWDKYHAKSQQILHGLDLAAKIDDKVSNLSGGWRTRLALGRSLLAEPSVLFLDETNNHLDLHASIWLCNYLSSYNKTIVMITHQADYINSLADYIWYIGNPECTGTKIYTIKGKIRHLTQFLTQTKKSVQDAYDKLQRKITEKRKKNCTKKEVDELIKKENAPRPPKEYHVKIEFEDVSLNIGTKNIIEFKNVSFGYNESSNVLNNVDFSITLQSRYVIVGENGAGKSTLFKLCTGAIEPISGEIYKDDRVYVAHYNQLIADTLPPDMSAIEYLQSIDSKIDENECRGRLGRIGLKKLENNDILKNKIKNLSGGQKVRVALCAIQLTSPSIILLDEPTNSLDIESIEALIEGINKFNGAIIVITHDAYLIESIKDCEIVEIKNNRLIKFKGEFDEYRETILDS